jgi:hypothetical protein
MGQVRTTFTSDDKDVVAALNRMTKELDKLREANRKLKEESKKGSEESKSGLEQSVRSIAKMAAGYATATTALRLFNSELERKSQLEKAALDTQLSVNQSRADVIRNAGAISRQEASKLLSTTQQVSQRTGISEKQINAGFAAGLSSAGSGTVEDVKNAVLQAARFVPDRPEELGRTVGSSFDLSKVTGTMDVRTNLGALAAVGKFSRIADPQKQAVNIAPALINMKSFGADFKEGGALFAALSTGMGDFYGEKSKTGGINLTRQLSEFLPKEDLQTGTDARGRPKIVKGTGLASLDPRIQFLRQNPKKAKEFMRTGDFGEAEGVIKQLLLDPNSGVYKDYDSAFKSLPGVKDTADFFERTVSNFAADPTFKVAEANRAVSQVMESAQADNMQGAANAQAREALDALFDIEGRSGISKRFAIWDYNLSTQNGPEFVLDRLKQRRFGALGSPEAPGFGAEQNPEMIDRLDRLIKAMEQLIPQQQAQPVNVNNNIE